MTDTLEISVLGPSDIDLVAPLWRALLDHIASLAGAGVPVRPFEQSWPIERRHMQDALADDAYLVVARRGPRPVGYAFVTIEEASSVWYTGERYAELAHLSVAPGERGRGVGTALFDAVDAELARRGIDDVQFGVDRDNDDAIRFYERRGYRHDFLIFYGSPGKQPWACRARDAADRAAGRGRYAADGADGSPDAASPDEAAPASAARRGRTPRTASSLKRIGPR